VRVWTFTFEPTKAFLAEVEALPRTDSREGLAFASPDRLHRLKIEHYKSRESRLRVHRWITTESGAESYRWWDLITRPASDDFSKEPCLWSYATEKMACVLNLSATWVWNPQKPQRSFYELVLWLDRSEHPVPPEHLIFRIPLEPGILDDQRGQGVFVRGRKVPASVAEPYPLDEASWEAKSGEGDAWRWSWYLSMETLDEELDSSSPAFPDSSRDTTRGQRLLMWLQSSIRCQRCGAKVLRTEPHVHIHLTWGRWRVAHQRCMGIETDYYGAKESWFLYQGRLC
jgi:hypothetical protein